MIINIIPESEERLHTTCERYLDCEVCAPVQRLNGEVVHQYLGPWRAWGYRISRALALIAAAPFAFVAAKCCRKRRE